MYRLITLINWKILSLN